jgi:Uma2 family endonuclease
MGDPLTAARPQPLQSGDRLARREFERRYAAHPEIKKAELIEGRVYLSSPLRFATHGEPHAAILTWLGTYAAFTPGVRAADNATVRLDEINEPQPDAQLRIEPAAGGHSRLDEDDYVAGAPELIVEVAASSASYDLHDKLRAYRRNGVNEYLVWRVQERRFDWFVLSEDDYVPLAADGSGILRSNVFPGLCLDVEALLAGDVARVLATLQRGLEASEHAAFVARLQR